MKFLIIDDDIIRIKPLIELLKLDDVVFDQVFYTEDAWEKLYHYHSKTRYSLIILDLIIPAKNMREYHGDYDVQAEDRGVAFLDDFRGVKTFDTKNKLMNEMRKKVRESYKDIPIAVLTARVFKTKRVDLKEQIGGKAFSIKQKMPRPLEVYISELKDEAEKYT